MNLVTTHIEGYDWIYTCRSNLDGSQSIPDIYGNELILYPNGTHKIVTGGFANPLGLKFTDPDGLEYIIMREIEDYHLDDVGLKAGSLVIDIGAHVGIVSMYMAKKYGCLVEAYEPAPDNYRRLVANIEANGMTENIFPHNLAVTKDGRKIWVGGVPEENSGGMSIYRYDDRISCDSVTLADIVGNRTIDLLKIDCEGAEYEILLNRDPLAHIKAVRGEFHSITIDWKKYDPVLLFAWVRARVENTYITIEKGKL